MIQFNHSLHDFQKRKQKQKSNFLKKINLLHRLIPCTVLFFLFFFQNAIAQTGGTLSGIVVNSSEMPLAFANLVLFESGEENAFKGQTTDEEGKYEFQNLPSGNYLIKVTYVGFDDFQKTVTLRDGEITELNVTLNNASLNAEITVWSPLFTNLLNQINYSPAVYDDPARTTALMPGVLNTNDQANHISIRGNNPSGLKWYLNGLEIPNPNHTPNAGTASDRISTSGGGVNMIKPYFTNSDFYNGGFQAGYGNAIGGAIDLEVIKLERPYQSRTSVKIGIIGLEAISRGFFNKESKASYNFNLRYSTVGLLTELIGLDFGGEKITFMDANMSAYFPSEKYGNFSIYNISGLSSNVFATQRDTSLWEEQKDQFDIDFYSATTITGVSHKKEFANIFREKMTWETAMMYSTWNSSRNAYRLNDAFQPSLMQLDSLEHRRFSFRSKISTKNWGLESKATQLDYQLLSFDSLANYQSNGRLRGILIEPNFYVQKKFDNQLVKFGLHTMFFSETVNYSIEPRFSYTLDLKDINGQLQFSYGFHSQMQSPEVYLSTDFLGNKINNQLDFTRSHHLNLKFLKDNPKLNYGFQVQAYYQYLLNVPIVNLSNRSFSVINDINTLITEPLENAGNGQNYGLELDFRTYYKSFYITLNTSLYQSLYRGGDNIWRNTRYNGNHITNLMVRKSWRFNKTSRRKSDKTSIQNIGVIARTLYAGGVWESPIDVSQSQQTGYTVFIENDAYSLRQPDFFKIDFRFYWEKNKYKASNFKRKHTLALDIQNLTNAQNFGFNYFDVLQGEVVTKYQLGLIPLLSWEVTF